MQMAEKAKNIKEKLENLGHETFIVDTNDKFIGQSDEKSDAILVLNYEKNEVKNYIGGNVFLEMGLAYYLKKIIYLINPIPDLPYETEIIAMKPIIINGDFTKIK